MELGDLELAVLRAIRTLGQATSGVIHEQVRKSRDVAYTSVTTTLYRLVDKGLVAMRKESEKKVYYRVREGRAYREAMASMIDRVVDAFGGAAVSYLLDNPGSVPQDLRQRLNAEIGKRRSQERKDG